MQFLFSNQILLVEYISALSGILQFFSFLLLNLSLPGTEDREHCKSYVEYYIANNFLTFQGARNERL